jgi:hypothetical protein
MDVWNDCPAVPSSRADVTDSGGDNIVQEIIDAAIIARILIANRGDTLTISKIDPAVKATLMEYFPKTHQYLFLVQSLGHTAEMIFPAAHYEAMEELSHVKSASMPGGEVSSS